MIAPIANELSRHFHWLLWQHHLNLHFGCCCVCSQSSVVVAALSKMWVTNCSVFSNVNIMVIIIAPQAT